jgi:hypothetical protein
MNPLSDLFGAPTFALLAAISFGLTVYAVTIGWKNRASRKHQRTRRRQRVAFWGFE